MNIEDLKRRIKKNFNGSKRVKLISFMLLTAALLIFLSDLLPDNKSSENVSEIHQDKMLDNDQRTEKLEAQLSDLLSQIEGVGKAEVIITLDGSEEYVYAEDISAESSGDGTDSKAKNQSKLVIIEKSGEKNALIKKVLSPKVSGALVVCDGGGDISVRERVIKAVSAALDLPTSKICVESRKK